MGIPLSSAFFRGVDAVILIVDVKQPETLRALDRWLEFYACARLNNDETEDYCLVVVGNKTNLVPSSEGRAARKKQPWTLSTNLSCCRDPYPVAE
jgi:GTPase SAR1 family protein